MTSEYDCEIVDETQVEHETIESWLQSITAPALAALNSDQKKYRARMSNRLWTTYGYSSPWVEITEDWEAFIEGTNIKIGII